MARVNDRAQLATPAPATASRSGRRAARAALDQVERAFTHALERTSPERPSEQLRESIASFIAGNAALMLRLPAADLKELGLQVRSQPAAAIDKALGVATQIHLEALRKAGLTPSMIVALRSLMDVTIEARLMQAQVELRGALEALLSLDKPRASPPPLVAGDPTESLNARELGRALGDVSEDTVRLREGRGELFSILRPGRKRGRQYPAFQAWQGIAGVPLTQVLEALGRPSGPDAYGFFTSPTELLGGLTPIEAMVGRMTSVRDLDAAAERFLLEPPDKRLETMLQVAHTEAAVLST